MKKIALFGTSADPPTSGHQTILRWLSGHYDAVAVWAADNPFKSHQSSLEQRMQMLRLLIDELDVPQHNIALHPELSSRRTLETVEKAKKLWGIDVNLTLVIGSDLVSQLPRWYQVEDLLRRLFQVLVIPRPGYPLNEADLRQLRQLGTAVAIANFNAPDVSSTAYRENKDTEALTPSIEAYIDREHLYKCQDTSKKRLQLR